MNGAQSFEGLRPYLASAALHAHVLASAPSHYTSETAPATWRELKAWRDMWNIQREHGACYVLPVFGGGCDNTIYKAPRYNYAFRAWHDCIHLTINAAFDYAGEMAVALSHRASVRGAGLSLEDARAIIFDTIGQYVYFQRYGKFVQNQALFVSACFLIGIKRAVEYQW